MTWDELLRRLRDLGICKYPGFAFPRARRGPFWYVARCTEGSSSPNLELVEVGLSEAPPEALDRIARRFGLDPLELDIIPGDEA
jgi:hypothetical protein